MKSLFASYILCALGFVCPFAGLHRFYLEKPGTGFLYLITWGFFGIGTLIDLVRMPQLVQEQNQKFLMGQEHIPLFNWTLLNTNPEREILKIAKKHHGIVTVELAVMATNLTFSQANDLLKKLHKQGHCHRDVDDKGKEIFIFDGLNPSGPLALS